MNKKIYIFGGGTIGDISSHFAVCSPAFGTTAKKISNLICDDDRFSNYDVDLKLTKMAGGEIRTNKDVENEINEIVKCKLTKIVFFNCALVDFRPVRVAYKFSNSHFDNFNEFGNTSLDNFNEFGKYNSRLDSRVESLNVEFRPENKIISSIRSKRKDIFLIGFKTTCGATKQEMYEKGLRLCKDSSCNLVLVNDVKTRWNMIITPEEACYHESEDRDFVLSQLVDMAYYRSQLTFTQSTVINSDLVSWNDERIPDNLRKIIHYCIDNGAYKKFNQSTVGHFAIKLSDSEFLTSIRKSNFNDIEKNGMVYVQTDGPDTVLAYGAKPSVGGQSQRIVFNDHAGFDCIVHFHCPLLENHADDIPIVSQREVECGSHQCGNNTSKNLADFGDIKCVMLDNHGPNIVFKKTTDPDKIIDFISRNFDLSAKTGGYNLI